MMNQIQLIIVLIMATLLPAEMLASQLGDRMEAAGMVDVARYAPDVMVDLMYDRADNFTGVRLYDGLDRAYMLPACAKAVARAQKLLQAERPGYRLKICDAARPMSVQRKMFRAVSGTPKARYVGNPRNGGGLHNYGAAVDITIVGPDGRELPMGTPVDHLGIEANIDREPALVKSGKITSEEMANRRLLRKVMTQAGFKTIRTEWWHFQLCSRSAARTSLRRLDF